MNSESTQSDSDVCRRVVLIHGLGANRAVMWPLKWYLNRKGFVATTFGYSSWWWSIEHHAKRFAAELDRLEQDPDVDAFAVVGHSLGGIVTRQAILDDGSSDSSSKKFSKLKRVVQLGSPNQGTSTAWRLKYLFPLCKTLRQISNLPGSFVLSLPPPSDVEFGIISASYDFVVSERSTHLATEKDHISVFSGHNGLLVRPRVLKQVAAFLTYGKFLR